MMTRATAVLIVFLGGFIIMLLEIIGARYLAKDFGGSFYVWVSQIGVVMIALAAGYYLGGALADRYQHVSFLVWLLVPAGIITFAIPDFSPRLIDALITRHPMNRDIPRLWQKLDPALGSALVFLLPCMVLAALGPCMIRLAVGSLSHVGRSSGLIIAASTVGSIAGVFVSGYVLIDSLSLSSIFRAMGGLTVMLGVLCLWVDRMSGAASAVAQEPGSL